MTEFGWSKVWMWLLESTLNDEPWGTEFVSIVMANLHGFIIEVRPASNMTKWVLVSLMTACLEDGLFLNMNRPTNCVNTIAKQPMTNTGMIIAVLTIITGHVCRMLMVGDAGTDVMPVQWVVYLGYIMSLVNWKLVYFCFTKLMIMWFFWWGWTGNSLFFCCEYLHVTICFLWGHEYYIPLDYINFDRKRQCGILWFLVIYSCQYSATLLIGG